MMGFRFAAPLLLLISALILFLAALLRSRIVKKPTYQYTLVQSLLAYMHTDSMWHDKLLWLLRAGALALMVFLMGKPQRVDSYRPINVDGIDIMMVLDVSGSMQFKDFADDDRTRLEVAKDEAMHFIQKRDQDAVGLVIFGNDAISRIPLTMDKQMVLDMIKQLELGLIDPDGTTLARAIVTAVSRLRNSKAASKVMIVLTDGEPSEHDINPSIAIEAAKKLGIKVYTIGIGSDQIEYFIHPFYGAMPKPRVNKELLERISQQTGGKFFMARNSQEMRSIYDSIDSLEKSKHDTPLQSTYYDVGFWLIFLIIGLLVAEIIAITYVWYGI